MAINDPKIQQNQMIRQPTQPQTQKRGSGFTNINRVLGANQNNRLGQSISQGVLGQAEQARGNIRQASSKFREEAGSNRLDTEANRVARQNILNKVTRETDTPPVLGEEETKQFEKFRTGTYGGPQQLGNEAEIRSQAENAQQLGRLTQSSGGRQGLLQRFAGGVGYGTGQQKIDQLLLSGAPGGLNAIRRYTAGLGEEQNRAINEARNLGAEYANRAKAFNQETGEAVKGAYVPIEQQIQGRVEAAKAQEEQRAKQFADIQNILKGGRPSEEAGARAAFEKEAFEKGIQKLQEGGLVKPEDLDRIRTGGVQLNKINPEDFDPNKMGNFQDFLSDMQIRNVPRGILGLGSTGFIDRSGRSVDPSKDYDFYKTSGGGFVAARKDKDVSGYTSELNRQALANAFSQQQAANINREGIMSDTDIARLNALNKLGGNINPEVVAGPRYQAGGAKFDINKYLQESSQFEPGKDKYRVL